MVSDIRRPDRNGDELFEKLQAEQLYVPPWIFITGYGTIERAIVLMKLGASDYVTKPFDLDQLVAKLRAYIPSSPRDERLHEQIVFMTSSLAMCRPLPQGWRSPNEASRP